jgi:hypothetical protein
MGVYSSGLTYSTTLFFKLAPARERKQSVSWKNFIGSHPDILVKRIAVTTAKWNDSTQQLILRLAREDQPRP